MADTDLQLETPKTTGVTDSTLLFGALTGTGEAVADTITASAVAEYMGDALPADGVIRELLTADRTYYVRTDGSDSNDGLADSAGGAFLTWQYAYDLVAATLDFGGYTVTIRWGSAQGGTRTFTVNGAPVISVDKGWDGAGILYVLGNAADPSDVVLSSDTGGIEVSSALPGFMYINGFEVDTPGGIGVAHLGTGTVTVAELSGFGGAMNFGEAGAHILASGTGAILNVTLESLSILDDASFHLSAANGCSLGYFVLNPVDIPGSPTFDAFVRAEIAGVVAVAYATYDVGGSVTGSKYSASGNSLIANEGDAFPGDTPGTVETGGRYLPDNPGYREVLVADRTYYVRTDGSDSNDGLTDSAGGAFLTWQAAYDLVAATLDFGGYTVTIRWGSAEGGPVTFSDDIVIFVDKGWVGGGVLYFLGDEATPSNVVLEATSLYCVFGQGEFPGSVYVNGFNFDASAGAGAVLNNAIGQMFVGGISSTGSVEVEASGFLHFAANFPAAVLFVYADVEILGDAYAHVLAGSLSYVDYSCTATIGSARAFTVFAMAGGEGALGELVSFATFAGAGVAGTTGSRYAVSNNSAIITGGGASFFPGDAPGTVSTGGRYLPDNPGYDASFVEFTPAGGIAATDVQAAIVELDTEKLAASSYTAADVLAKLLTVDGSGSGLDADLLDGQSSAAFQPADADLTSWAGVTRAAGFDTFAATPSSANLKSLVTDETGSGGALVFATGPTISGLIATGTPTAAGATWTDLGTVTTADINGGTVDGTVIGGATPAAGSFTTLVATTNAVVGHTALLGVGGTNDIHEVFGTDAATGGMALGMFSATAGTGPHFDFYRSKNAAIGSATVVAADDNLGQLTWYGAQQTGTFATQTAAAQIKAEVDGTVTSGAGADMPGRLVFSTTADGSGTLTERLRITSTGRKICSAGQVAHFWVYWTANSTTILASHNVTSIDDDATGDAGINLTVAFNGNNYAAFVCTNDTSNGWDDQEVQASGINVHTSATVDVLSSTITDGTTAATSLTDPEQWQAVGFGVSA